MRLIRAVAFGLSAVTLAFAAESFRPMRASSQGPQRNLAAKFREAQPVSPEEWAETESWMKVNCPNRLNFLGQLGDGPQKEQAKQLMADRYRQIKHTNYKPLQDALVQQAQAQDLIFGAQVKLRETRHEHVQHELARNALHAAVGKLFDAELQEKGARVGRLQTEIEHLRKNRTTVIDEWTRGMMKRVNVAVPAAPDSERSSPGESASPGELPATTNP